MSTVDLVMKELGNASRLLTMRPGAKLESGLQSSIIAKLKAIPSFGTGDATTFFVQLDTLSLPDAFKGALKQACDARLAVHLTSSGGVMSRSGMIGAPARDQIIRFLNNYPRLSDWHVLEDHRSSPAKRDQCIAELLSLLGIRRASEEGCIKWAMVIIMHIENNINGGWQSYQEVYQRVIYIMYINPSLMSIYVYALEHWRINL